MSSRDEILARLIEASGGGMVITIEDLPHAREIIAGAGQRNSSRMLEPILEPDIREDRRQLHTHPMSPRQGRHRR